MIIFHVPAAIFCYIFFIACISTNIGIHARRKWSPATAIALCETGLLFAAITLSTGAIWAHSAWGTAWVWEPRLTGMFLLTLFFLSWRLACAIVGPELTAKGKFTAPLILLGLPSMAFTHLAVRLFGGIHPQQMPTSSAQIPIWHWIAIIICYAVVSILLTRYRSQTLKKKLEQDCEI